MQPLPILGSPENELAASDPANAKGTYAFVSLGCPKNLIDSEKMLGSLALDGYVARLGTRRRRLRDRQYLRIHRKLAAGIEGRHS